MDGDRVAAKLKEVALEAESLAQEIVDAFVAATDRDQTPDLDALIRSMNERWGAVTTEIGHLQFLSQSIGDVFLGLAYALDAQNDQRRQTFLARANEAVLQFLQYRRRRLERESAAPPEGEG